MLERFFGRKISTCRGGIFSALNAPTRTIHSVAAFVAVFGRKIFRPYRCCKAIRPNIPTCTTHSVAVFVAVFVVRISTCKAIHSLGRCGWELGFIAERRRNYTAQTWFRSPPKARGERGLRSSFLLKYADKTA